MKKKIICVAIVIAILVLIGSTSLGIFILYTRRNINYDFDEELFKKAKDDMTVYYYAYNSSGELLEVFKSSKDSKREWTSFSDVNDRVKQGFIAMEDRDFYKHKGVNFKRTIAAVINYIFKTRSTFGASTITQQVIKNISGDNEANISRKAKEILRSINLEMNHSKDDIFELYMNIIPMSGNTHGVGAAAEIYFGKEARELSLVEAASIVGITNAPAKYNPYTHPDACVEKRNKVLYAMRDVGFIDDTEYENAIKAPLVLNSGTGNFGVSSWFIETANEEIISDICSTYAISKSAANLLLGGCKVILTMNPDVQNILQNYFSDTNNLSIKASSGLNYSMVVSDPYTGDLIGVIGNGGKKRADKLFNYATANITPGSVLKPIALYAPLIDDNTITWSSIFDDSPIEYTGEYGTPYPRNSPDVYEGMIDINEALRKSKNTVAVRLYNILGANRIYDHLKNDFGLDTLVEKASTVEGKTVTDLSCAPLALGQLSYGVSLRKLTESYSVFPSCGVLSRGRSYTSIYDREGNCILEKGIIKKEIYSEETAQIMNQLLSNVVFSGTAKQIKLKELVDVAGKTGTSSGDRDRLFVGYTPYFTAGIWTGYGDSNTEVGSNSPNHLEIWDNVMRLIHEKLVFNNYTEEINSFSTNKVIIKPYCSISGLTPTDNCELDDDSIIKFGYFSAHDLLDKKCDYH